MGGVGLIYARPAGFPLARVIWFWSTMPATDSRSRAGTTNSQGSIKAGEGRGYGHGYLGRPGQVVWCASH